MDVLKLLRNVFEIVEYLFSCLLGVLHHVCGHCLPEVDPLSQTGLVRVVHSFKFYHDVLQFVLHVDCGVIYPVYLYIFICQLVHYFLSLLCAIYLHSVDPLVEIVKFL